MIRRQLPGTSIRCLLLVCVTLSYTFISSEARQPNIVILLADDLGYGELGCQGNGQIPTPHIDSIADDGVRFTAGYVTAPYCSASRAGLLTGRYQTRFGYEFNPVGHQNEDPDAGLPVSEKTLAKHLQDAGYATALIGKWHLGGHAKFDPLRRGFDEFYGFTHEGHYFVPPPYAGVTTMLRRRTLPRGGQGRWIRSDGKLILTTHMGHNEPAYDANNPILRGGQPVQEHEYLTDALTREAVDFIGRNKERPFFLYLAYNAVHSPLQGADGYMAKFAHLDDIHRRIFAAMLANLDDSVGEVLAKLRGEELDRDTLIFFLSDNGGPTRELTSSNRPLRGEKGQVYEGGIRIPFMAKWPGRLPAGVVYTQPVVSLDIFATSADAAHAPISRSQKIDGVNLLPYLTGQIDQPPHDSLYWRLREKTAVRVGDWKLLRNPTSDQGEWQLYHLGKDIGETLDLAGRRPKKLQELQSHWARIDAEMIDPVWGPNR